MMPSTSGCPYQTLPAYPESCGSGAVLSRLVAGLGFRLHWATDGLLDEDASFRAHPEASSIGEVLEHIGQMVVWIHGEFTRGLSNGSVLPDLPQEHSFTQRRAHCLESLALLESDLVRMDAEQLSAVRIESQRGDRPFWVALNGPLADALTHVGQISVWRRQLGKPAPASDPFDGLPPAANEG